MSSELHLTSPRKIAAAAVSGSIRRLRSIDEVGHSRYNQNRSLPPALPVAFSPLSSESTPPSCCIFSSLHSPNYAKANMIHQQTYSKQEIMFMWVTAENSSDILLEPGVHNYPFSFLLPPNLPSSFAGLHGTVKYKMKAVIDRPMRLDEKAEVHIILVRLLNLNMEPQALKGAISVVLQRPYTGCCYRCCCIKGLPDINITLNRGCFVPGEMILVGGQVTNRTNTKIKRTTISFVQRKQFWATGIGGRPYRSTCQFTVLARTDRPAVECGQVDSWNAVAFNVPLVEASRLDGCNIINVVYYIQVKTDFTKCCADSVACQEVVIGHIPLQEGAIAAQPPGYFPNPASLRISYPPMPTNFNDGMFNAGCEIAESPDKNQLAEVHES